jgi:hypothetical protein
MDSFKLKIMWVFRPLDYKCKTIFKLKEIDKSWLMVEIEKN